MDKSDKNSSLDIKGIYKNLINILNKDETIAVALKRLNSEKGY